MIKHVVAGIGLLGCIGLLFGCAEVLVPGTLAGAWEAYRYTTSNIAKETLIGDVSQVTVATRSALKKMNIRLYAVDPGNDKTVMTAKTSELHITIKAMPVTSSTTRVTVDAIKDRVVKDKATATEILSQIRAALDRRQPPGEAFTRVYIKNNCRRTIYVAVHYLAGKNEPQSWQTRGWFTVAAGQKKHIADTHNRYIYFYAETRLADKLYWGGEDFHWFEGNRFGFFKADIGGNPEDITQAFKCD